MNPVSLDDKYTQTSGRVFISAIQALVRLPLDQIRRDRAGGLATAGFISGYRGSPLGGYDSALWAASALLAEHGIRFNPGVNEEIAATSMRGAQQLDWFGTPDVRGMFGLWYGKGLGVDRACEALKLGNLEGASAHGGVLVVAGDDHGGRSSVSAHQSEHTLIAGLMPVLYPADIGEILAYGIAGWDLSRYSGLWIGLKNVTDTLDVSATVELPSPHLAFARPPMSEHLNLRPGQGSLAQEERVVLHRLPAAQAFVRANGLDRAIIDGPRRTLTLVAAGKAYLDTRQALADLGLDAAACRNIGLRLFKPAMIWPLEPTVIRDFVAGSREVLVIEEKRPVIEDQLARLLYGVPADARPDISGKHTPAGEPLLPAHGELGPAAVAEAIARRLAALGPLDSTIQAAAARLSQRRTRARTLEPSGATRPAYFCSGCPHNTSTRVPEGSTAMSAVGCHGLVVYTMPERRTMPPMPMGGDGMPWLAAAPHVPAKHIFQNMGDGTYEHSGILAIRAAVAAGTNITFKLLCNDAVAMTGGQPVEGGISAADIVRQLLAERVHPVVLVSDEPGKHRDIVARHRDELDIIQREIRESPGVSAIVYEQTCATEKRRRRKRGTLPAIHRRVFINPEVCEDCGDCSAQSNCVSIAPLQTEFGQKRRIDQSSCNSDLSCVKGFCPSFVTVEGGTIARDTQDVPALAKTLPEPALGRLGNILVAGIGGTGVLTIGALLGMAAHLDGIGCKVTDTTGIAQKGGAVTSHLRFAARHDTIFSGRLNAGMAEIILGCDAVVASGLDVLGTVRVGETVGVVNADITPTGDFQRDAATPDGDAIRLALAGALGTLDQVNATQLATRFVGDSIAANMIMLGYALQKGLLPVTLAALTRAIELNASAVASNVRALTIGRLAAHDPAFGRSEPAAERDLATIVASRLALLTAYQNAGYARRYARFVAEVGTKAAGFGAEAEKLTREVAIGMARLMAYKDEYEVARLHSSPGFARHLRAQFSGDLKLTFHLAPPTGLRAFFSLLLVGRAGVGGEGEHELPKRARSQPPSRPSPQGGGRSRREPSKRAFGGWIQLLFPPLAALKFLRGTAFDPFGHTAERRAERGLITEYERLIRDMLRNTTDLETALAIASAPRDVKGFGAIKAAAIERYHARIASLRRDPHAA